jgi:transcriptional regulator with XRE-family HTH domain
MTIQQCYSQKLYSTKLYPRARGIVSALGDLLREGRKKQNLTQDQLAEILDVSQPSVSDWESGAKTPRMKQLRPLATVLGIPRQWLLEAIGADAEAKQSNPEPAQGQGHGH